MKSNHLNDTHTHTINYRTNQFKSNGLTEEEIKKNCDTHGVCVRMNLNKLLYFFWHEFHCCLQTITTENTHQHRRRMAPKTTIETMILLKS